MTTKIVGWLIDIDFPEGKQYLSSFSEDIEFEEVTWIGSGRVVTISPVEDKVGLPNNRLEISLLAVETNVREALMEDPGPAVTRVRWVYYDDEGNLVLVPRAFMGRLSRPRLEGEIYTVDVEKFTGDIDIGEVLIWSHETQLERYPDDFAFEYLRELVEGKVVEWPP